MYNGYPYQQMYNPYPQQIQQPASRMIEVFASDSVTAAEEAPVRNGTTQMFIAKDDSFIAVKSVSLDGAPSFSVYDKRPPAPPVPALDPAAYVTRDELETRLAALSAPRRSNKKEADNESV